MIVDAHTHVFPPAFIRDRDALVGEEPVFAELYGAAKAAMATADDLLLAMDEAGVDRAVIAGFAWADPERCVRHNDALLEAAAANDRLLAFCSVPLGPPGQAQREMERCVRAGAAGFGELRPDLLGVDLDRGPLPAAVAEAARALDRPLLLHASEPVGHAYAGKGGGSLTGIWRFLAEHDGIRVVLAHLGGGLPFFAHMAEVRALFARTYVDTAAAPWLYEARALRTIVDLIGAKRVLFGSDFPLRHPARDIAWLDSAGLDAQERAAILGGNAADLLSMRRAERWPA